MTSCAQCRGCAHSTGYQASLLDSPPLIHHGCNASCVFVSLYTVNVVFNCTFKYVLCVNLSLPRFSVLWSSKRPCPPSTCPACPSTPGPPLCLRITRRGSSPPSGRGWGNTSLSRSLATPSSYWIRKTG